jgi:hypothetical protein
VNTKNSSKGYLLLGKKLVPDKLKVLILSSLNSLTSYSLFHIFFQARHPTPIGVKHPVVLPIKGGIFALIIRLPGTHLVS